jgi:hypothetical protein
MLAAESDDLALGVQSSTIFLEKLEIIFISSETQIFHIYRKIKNNIYGPPSLIAYICTHMGRTAGQVFGHVTE